MCNLHSTIHPLEQNGRKKAGFKMLMHIYRSRNKYCSSVLSISPLGTSQVPMIIMLNSLPEKDYCLQNEIIGSFKVVDDVINAENYFSFLENIFLEQYRLYQKALNASKYSCMTMFFNFSGHTIANVDKNISKTSK